MSDLTASRTDPRPRTRWGWFVALGIAQLVLGIIAWFDVIAFTIAGVIFIGALLLVAGVFQIVHAFMDREWGGFALHLLVGVLYVIGGFLLMDEPFPGSLVITILVAAALIIGGILRIVIGVQHRHMPGWGLLLGRRRDQPGGRLMLVLTLPWSGLWVVGTLIAVELIMHGVSWIQFGLALRKTALAPAGELARRYGQAVANVSGPASLITSDLPGVSLWPSQRNTLISRSAMLCTRTVCRRAKRRSPRSMGRSAPGRACAGSCPPPRTWSAGPCRGGTDGSELGRAVFRADRQKLSVRRQFQRLRHLAHRPSPPRGTASSQIDQTDQILVAVAAAHVGHDGERSAALMSIV